MYLDTNDQNCILTNLGDAQKLATALARQLGHTYKHLAYHHTNTPHVTTQVHKPPNICKKNNHPLLNIHHQELFYDDFQASGA